MELNVTTDLSVCISAIPDPSSTKSPSLTNHVTTAPSVAVGLNAGNPSALNSGTIIYII